jgi:hypothetical protein
MEAKMEAKLVEAMNKAHSGLEPSPQAQDMAWLLGRRPDATEAGLEAFAERVSICIADGAMDEEGARLVAERSLYGTKR